MDLDPWAAVADDRRLLADVLERLTDAQRRGPSLCEAWTVRDVAGHVLAMATISKAAALATYLGAGCNQEATNDALVARATMGLTDDQLIDALRANAGARHTPPGLKAEGVFGELVAHLGDVSLATGATVDLPADHLTTALAYLARRVKGNTRFTATRHGRRPVLDCHDRIDGVRLDATDVAWSTGQGPAVHGPALALMAAMTGRAGALEHLDGDGVAVLRARPR